MVHFISHVFQILVRPEDLTSYLSQFKTHFRNPRNFHEGTCLGLLIIVLSYMVGVLFIFILFYWWGGDITWYSSCDLSAVVKLSWVSKTPPFSRLELCLMCTFKVGCYNKPPFSSKTRRWSDGWWESRFFEMTFALKVTVKTTGRFVCY